VVRLHAVRRVVFERAICSTQHVRHKDQILSNRYTAAQIVEAVTASTSIAGVLVHLGIKYRSGAAWSWVRRHINRNNINIDHFGPTSRRGLKKNKSPSAILVITDGMYRVPGRLLKQAMLALGTKEECAECGQGPVWRNVTLTLEVDHINGDWRDCRYRNLRLICPNCHSQAPTSKRMKKIWPTVSLVCAACKEPFTRAGTGRVPPKRPTCSKRCASHLIPPRATKVRWPNATRLRQMVATMPLRAIGHRLGVSDKAVKKRCNKLGIITTKGRGAWGRNGISGPVISDK